LFDFDVLMVEQRSFVVIILATFVTLFLTPVYAQEPPNKLIRVKTTGGAYDSFAVVESPTIGVCETYIFEHSDPSKPQRVSVEALILRIKKNSYFSKVCIVLTPHIAAILSDFVVYGGGYLTINPDNTVYINEKNCTHKTFPSCLDLQDDDQQEPDYIAKYQPLIITDNSSVTLVVKDSYVELNGNGIILPLNKFITEYPTLSFLTSFDQVLDNFEKQLSRAKDLLNNNQFLESLILVNQLVNKISSRMNALAQERIQLFGVGGASFPYLECKIDRFVLLRKELYHLRKSALNELDKSYPPFLGTYGARTITFQFDQEYARKYTITENPPEDTRYDLLSYLSDKAQELQDPWVHLDFEGDDLFQALYIQTEQPYEAALILEWFRLNPNVELFLDLSKTINVIFDTKGHSAVLKNWTHLKLGKGKFEHLASRIGLQLEWVSLASHNRAKLLEYLPQLEKASRTRNYSSMEQLLADVRFNMNYSTPLDTTSWTYRVLKPLYLSVTKLEKDAQGYRKKVEAYRKQNSAIARQKRAHY